MITKLLVKKLLEHPFEHSWSFQGLGMLRCYLSREVRLHVWDPRMAFPNASTLHTHPWDFSSRIIAGRMVDTVFEIRKDEPATHHVQKIQCGPGGCAKGESYNVSLRRAGTRTVGDSLGSTGYQTGYTLNRDAIHESRPEPGTVSIIQRSLEGDTEHAFVFWPLGTQWVTAEPRPAADREVKVMTRLALERWFS